MASKIIKLTTNDFEQGNLLRNDSDIGKTFSQLKIGGNARIRSKALIPIMSKREILCSGDLKARYDVQEWDEEGKFNGRTECDPATSTIPLRYNTAFVTFVAYNANPSTDITPSAISSSTFTIETKPYEPEFEEQNGLIYTTKRNLLTRTIPCIVSGTGNKTTPYYALCAGYKQLLKGRVITVSMQIDIDSVVFDLSATSFKRLLIEPAVRYKDGTIQYCTCAINWDDPVNVLKSTHGRIYKTFQIQDKEIDDVLGTRLYIQNVKSGTVKLSEPMVTLGSEHYPYMPAPEEYINYVAEQHDQEAV